MFITLASLVVYIDQNLCLGLAAGAWGVKVHHQEPVNDIRKCVQAAQFSTALSAVFFQVCLCVRNRPAVKLSCQTRITSDTSSPSFDSSSSSSSSSPFHLTLFCFCCVRIWERTTAAENPSAGKLLSFCWTGRLSPLHFRVDKNFYPLTTQVNWWPQNLVEN